MTILEVLQSSPSFLLVTCCVLGLFVGSFLNVVIHRLPIMMQRTWECDCRELLEIEQPDDSSQSPFNLVTPRSRCPKCSKPIAAWENVPVLSWLLLRGKCSACKNPISVRYPLVETVTAVLSLAVAWQFGATLQTVFALLLTWALVALAMIDFDTTLLPDSITLPLMWLGLLASLIPVFTDVHSSLIGAMAGYLSLWIVFQAFKLFTGKEGMGFGDFKLLAALGAWLGWQQLPTIILLSSLTGAVIGIMLMVLFKHRRDQAIPFGPYLAIAGWLTMMWGEEIAYYYQQLLMP
jgi:leader peptidase (prepilin peptidase)/N-methyltransferase